MGKGGNHQGLTIEHKHSLGRHGS
uniref:Uncharacterized protein n=1 Tax=Vitis vinifera TaxID=29760 RepID=F6H8M2_VITVI